MRHNTIETWLTWILITLVLGFICLPGLWIVLSSFRPNAEILAKPAIWIPELTLGNYKSMFGIGPDANVAIPVENYFMNSLIISLTSTVIAVFSG